MPFNRFQSSTALALCLGALTLTFTANATELSGTGESPELVLEQLPDPPFRAPADPPRELDAR